MFTLLQAALRMILVSISVFCSTFVYIFVCMSYISINLSLSLFVTWNDRKKCPSVIRVCPVLFYEFAGLKNIIHGYNISDKFLTQHFYRFFDCLI